jgi:hypothetical protein
MVRLLESSVGGLFNHTRMDTPRKEIWFKRKEYGWGWVPCTWQGWLATAIYIALLLAIATTLGPNEPTAKEISVGFLLPIILVSAGFVRFCYAYGESPRWQWGREKDI